MDKDTTQTGKRGAPIGNTNAAGKNIETPERMWELFCEYKAWCKSNPRFENVVIPREMTTLARELERPMTWNGFDTWLMDNGIIKDTEDYRGNLNGAYSLYSEVVTRIGKVINTDKFEGATVGIYNANIIARDLGLIDTKDVTSEGKSIAFQVPPSTTDTKSDAIE